MERTRIKFLLERYIQGLADPEEQAEFFAWLRSEKDDFVIRELLASQWQQYTTEATIPAARTEQLFQSILDAAALLQEEEVATVYPLLHWKRWVAAAAVLLLFAAGSYFIFIKKDRRRDDLVKTEAPASDVKAPETNRAMITLADGRQVYLDSVGNGQLAMEGNIKLVKLANGQIAYQTATSEIIKELKYNTLSNPRGSKVIDMTLADGSRVWLNAGSSVTYPVAFVGNERKVSITGEAYFEVAQDKTKPFFVSKGDVSVQVLGTHFNVNAYDDESTIKVTLLEGSVRVQSETGNRKSEVVIKPGEQAQVGNGIVVKKGIDVEAVIAWKDGRFQFNGAGLEDMMRQIARWYDVKIIYETQAKDLHFTGGISRDVEASKVFKMLETTEAVHFRIEGKRIFVMK